MSSTALTVTLYRELLRSCRRISQMSRLCPDHTPVVLEVARCFAEEQEQSRGLRLTRTATRWDVDRKDTVVRSLPLTMIIRRAFRVASPDSGGRALDVAFTGLRCAAALEIWLQRSNSVLEEYEGLSDREVLAEQPVARTIAADILREARC